MKRRGLAVINGLVLSAICVATAWGQASTTERKSLAERMGALRRGWAQDESTEPAGEFPSPEGENRSLIPNWLNGGNDKRSAQARGAHPQNQSQTQNQSQKQKNTARQPSRFGQTPTTQSAAPAATRPSPTRSTSADHFTLPGLGGAPLPAQEAASAQNRASRNNSQERYGVTPETDANYPVIRDVTPHGQSATSSAATGASPTRQSAGRRISPQIGSEALRRELSNSFSGSASSSEPIARTAQGNGSNSTSEETAVSDAIESSATNQHGSSADPSLLAPVVEQSPATTGLPVTAAPAHDDSQNAVEAFGGTSGRKPAFGVSEFIRSPRSNSLPELPSAARSKEAFGEALQVAGGGDPSVLVSNQAPVISTDIRGPKQILVGREAVYRVRLQNQSAAAADGIVATIRIPSFAEVIDTTATQGTVQPSQNEATPGQLEWQLSSLEPRGSEVLDIRLVPRESRPLELGISWTLAPLGSRAIVEVQEPQLKVEIGGPNEVLFDKPQVFSLTLSNPGTGTAENVRIDLVPPGGTQEAATSHPMGDLLPGDSKSVEIELTAREAGKLNVKAIASAEGGLISDVSKEIFCRKPELEVDWRGPATKYAGTPATYFFRVRNPGTAPAEDVTVQVTLPEGTEFNSASEGQSFDAEHRQITWRVGTLQPGDDNYMELKCVVKTPGVNQLNITAATSAGDLKDSAVAETDVVALADLKLSVSDPSGPIAVGSQALYEIRVENRGANTAKNVNVVALFSDGIEPDKADGATYNVADGRVSFQPIEELPAGRDVTLRIRARALQAGTHVFRAEVLCSDLEIKLAAEETTRFYSDEVLPDSDEPAEASAPATSRYGFESTVR